MSRETYSNKEKDTLTEEQELNNSTSENVDRRKQKSKESVLNKIKTALDNFGPTPITEEETTFIEVEKPEKKKVPKKHNTISLKQCCTNVIIYLKHNTKAVVSALIVFVCFTVMFIFSIWQNNVTTSETIAEIENSVVLKWVNLFCEQQYTNSDNYVADPTYRIYNAEYIENVKNTEFYTTAIDNISDSITSVSIDKIIHGTYNNQSVYTLTLTLIPYTRIDSLDTNIVSDTYQTRVNDLTNKFITNSISEYEYQQGIKDIALDVYKEVCFKTDSTTTPIKVQVVLAQQENEQGNLVVYGTEQFLTTVMEQSNVYANTEVFQKEITKYLATLNTIQDDTENGK